MGAKPCGTPCTTFRNQRGNGVLLRRRRSAIVAGVAAAAGAALSASPGESGRCFSQIDRTGDARMISRRIHRNTGVGCGVRLLAVLLVLSSSPQPCRLGLASTAP